MEREDGLKAQCGVAKSFLHEQSCHPGTLEAFPGIKTLQLDFSQVYHNVLPGGHKMGLYMLLLSCKQRKQRKNRLIERMGNY